MLAYIGNRDARRVSLLDSAHLNFTIPLPRLGIDCNLRVGGSRYTTGELWFVYASYAARFLVRLIYSFFQTWHGNLEKYVLFFNTTGKNAVYVSTENRGHLPTIRDRNLLEWSM